MKIPKTTKLTVFGFDGSRSRHGKTAQLLKTAIIASELKPVKNIYEADAIIIATPVQWFNMTAKTKEFIDSLEESPNFPLKGKVAGFLAVCDEDGAQSALSLMAAAFNHMGCIIPPWGMMFYNSHGHKKSEDRWQDECATTLGESIKEIILTVK